MNSLRLRFPNRQQPDLVLVPGVHVIGRDASERPVLLDSALVDGADVDSPAVDTGHFDGADDAGRAVAQFCVDRRGVWLQVRKGAHGVHVNGRPVRRMALLRAGDAVFVDGNEWTLLGETPLSAPAQAAAPRDTINEPRVVLRGVGGAHHGRSITLDQPRVVGRLPECDIRIDDAAFADRHACLEPHPEGTVLRDLGSHEGSRVNGWPVRNALLRPGDQVVFETHRFVVEAPRRELEPEERPAAEPAVVEPPSEEPARHKLPSSVRRVPWLLLAALFLAGALSLLLLYGAR